MTYSLYDFAKYSIAYLFEVMIVAPHFVFALFLVFTGLTRNVLSIVIQLIGG